MTTILYRMTTISRQLYEIIRKHRAMKFQEFTEPYIDTTLSSRRDVIGFAEDFTLFIDALKATVVTIGIHEWPDIEASDL